VSRVTDKKSSWILIYFQTCESIYTQKIGLIKTWLSEWDQKAGEYLIKVRINLRPELTKVGTLLALPQTLDRLKKFFKGQTL